MLLPPPPIIPRQDGAVKVGLVNQEAESNNHDVDVLARYHASMELKKKHDMCKSNAPPLSHSSNYSDDVMVRTKPESEHHQNNLNDDETIVHPNDVMVGTKPKIEHHEDNNNQTNHKRELTQCQRQHIHDSKQILLQLGHSNTAYKNLSTISIDKKSSNASCLKLPAINNLSHHYVLIDKTHKPFLPVCIYEITPFEVSSGHSQILKDLIITLMSLSQNRQEIKTINNS
ncbi:hypothetical protein O181_093970 [Austropuccinia psidii MF-1]|uniref:Uncharacterized protein n=1 Tax=Austropuccinia psidii MF-1 TaxID=1389203 RepID=A0A9Q3PAM3_9BASI|nr:hypothetical protein [Austropuccinia psidii MF-1]